MKKKELYLVGNAHLDPMWQWRWQEGSAEAKATIRSALDRMKEFPKFRFVCSSASVYQWVEEFAPEMFEEVKRRIAEGRFIIVGGWHVQPDCNLPSGEGFARQSLYAQRYFMDRFGKTATVGYDVDSFGHNAMLPQILQKSGMNCYVFMRPSPREKDMESDLFRWTSPDGSSVLTYRILDPYCFNFSDMESLEQRLEYLERETKADTDVLPFFYGVGNHGGGPTVRNLELLEEFEKNHPEYRLIYSDVQDCFDAVRASGAPIPQHRDDLQHHANGCYSTVFHLKNGVRRSEVNLLAAEAYGALAGALCGKKQRPEVFREAWKHVNFLHFHDSMGGCCIQEAHDESREMYGYAMQTASQEENNALQTISWAVDTGDSAKGLPLVVFNPHSFEAEQLVRVNTQCDSVTDETGAAVSSQWVHASSQECYWRRDTLFRARVPALGYAVYYLQNARRAFSAFDPAEAAAHNGADGPARAVLRPGNRTANRQDAVVLENDLLRVEIETYSGYLLAVTEKDTGKQWLSDRAAVPVVIDEYYHDAWSHAKNFFTDQMARFSDARVAVTESGPLRAEVKVVSRYNDSTLTQYFSLEAGSRKLSVRAAVDWHERHKMLKLAWPMNVRDPEAFYEIPFGVIRRPADGEEKPGLTWTAVKGADGGFALLNNNTYSSSVSGGTIYQTVTRSPIYGDHGGPRDEESVFMNQGLLEFSYGVMPVSESWAPVIREAKLLNKPLTHIIETWHSGPLAELRLAGLTVSAENIMLSACKRSEDGNGLVLRLYETDGKAAKVTVSGKILPVPLHASFTPWSVNTYYLADGADAWEEVLLTEFEKN